MRHSYRRCRNEVYLHNFTAKIESSKLYLCFCIKWRQSRFCREDSGCIVPFSNKLLKSHLPIDAMNLQQHASNNILFCFNYHVWYHLRPFTKQTTPKYLLFWLLLSGQRRVYQPFGESNLHSTSPWFHVYHTVFPDKVSIGTNLQLSGSTRFPSLSRPKLLHGELYSN